MPLDLSHSCRFFSNLVFGRRLLERCILQVCCSRSGDIELCCRGSDCVSEANALFDMRAVDLDLIAANGAGRPIMVCRHRFIQPWHVNMIRVDGSIGNLLLVIIDFCFEPFDFHPKNFLDCGDGESALWLI